MLYGLHLLLAFFTRTIVKRTKSVPRKLLKKGEKNENLYSC